MLNCVSAEFTSSARAMLTVPVLWPRVGWNSASMVMRVPPYPSPIGSPPAKRAGAHNSTAGGRGRQGHRRAGKHSVVSESWQPTPKTCISRPLITANTLLRRLVPTASVYHSQRVLNTSVCHSQPPPHLPAAPTLRDESGNDAMEQQAVIEPRADEILNPLYVVGRDFGQLQSRSC